MTQRLQNVRFGRAQFRSDITPPTLNEILMYLNNVKPGLFGSFNPQEGRQIKILARVATTEYLEYGMTASIGRQITSDDSIFGEYIPPGVVGYQPNIYSSIDSDTNLNRSTKDIASWHIVLARIFSAPVNPNSLPPELDLLSTFRILSARTNDPEGVKEYLRNRVQEKLELIQEDMMPYLYAVFGYLYLQMSVFNLVPLPEIPYSSDWVFDAKGLPLYFPMETSSPEEKQQEEDEIIREHNKMRSDILSMYYTVMEHIDTLWQPLMKII